MWDRDSRRTGPRIRAGRRRVDARPVGCAGHGTDAAQRANRGSGECVRRHSRRNHAVWLGALARGLPRGGPKRAELGRETPTRADRQRGQWTDALALGRGRVAHPAVQVARDHSAAGVASDDRPATWQADCGGRALRLASRAGIGSSRGHARPQRPPSVRQRPAVQAAPARRGPARTTGSGGPLPVPLSRPVALPPQRGHCGTGGPVRCGCRQAGQLPGPPSLPGGKAVRRSRETRSRSSDAR